MIYGYHPIIDWKRCMAIGRGSTAFALMISTVSVSVKTMGTFMKSRSVTIIEEVRRRWI